ncbi:NUDIX domain-containing protein [bacterium]|nr:NUDIX domain-containing protein [bacterium]
MSQLRPNVCILLLNREGKLFLGERVDEFNHWQFPQGGVEAGDSPEEAVIRELREELGIGAENLRIIHRLNSTYSYEWDQSRWYGESEFSGQSQTFWLVEFLGEDSDIDLHTSEQEFHQWQWIEPEDAMNTVAEIRRSGYKHPLEELQKYLKTKDSSKGE